MSARPCSASALNINHVFIEQPVHVRLSQHGIEGVRPFRRSRANAMKLQVARSSFSSSGTTVDYERAYLLSIKSKIKPVVIAAKK